MPVYEFRCSECGHRFSEIRKMGDSRAVCPECKSANTEKLMSAFSNRSHPGGCSHSGGG